MRRWGIFCALVLASTACVGYRGPREIQDLVAERGGDRVERELGLSLGRVSTALIRGVIRLGGDDGDPDAAVLEGVAGLQVAIYDVSGGDGSRRPVDLSRLERRGWETIARVRDRGEQTLIQARADGDSMRELVVVSVDDDEVVYVRLKGHLDKAVGRMMQESVAKHGAKSVTESLLASAEK